MKTNRRTMLKSALFGAGLVGLKAMATGLPLWAFSEGMSPSAALAAEPADARFLILITNSLGDPFNANVPGAYGIDGVVNNPNPEMAEQALRLGGVMTSAAAPWSTLPQGMLDQTSFIHHRTYQNVHSQWSKVMALVGSAKDEEGAGNEELTSLISSELSSTIGTIQQEPVALGSTGLSFKGAQLQSIKPSTLAEFFGAPDADRLNLVDIRETAIDDLYALAKQDGTQAQRAWIDRYVTSRRQVKAIDVELVNNFSSITDDSPSSQIKAALTLFMMRLTSVVTIDIPFGGDNHVDADLTLERDQMVSGVEALKELYEAIQSSPLKDQIMVANLGVFGRTLGKNGVEGRDHNLNHHVMMLSGPGVNGGVIGGIEPSGNDFGAMDIDSATGAGVEGGDISKDESLESASKTLARLVGIPDERIELRIEGGKYIDAILDT